MWLLGLSLALLVGLPGLLMWAARTEPDMASAIARPASADGSGVSRDVSPTALFEPRFIGVVVADGRVDVSAKFDGRLASVDVKVGERVRQGQRLAQLDTAPLERELAVSEADVQQSLAQQDVARVALAEARDKVTRGGDDALVRLGAMSAEEQARLRFAEQSMAAQLAVAQAQVRTSQARLGQLKLRLSEAVLRAPFDGRISMRYLDAGATVAAGTPVVHLLRDGARMIRFAIPEQQATRVTVGMPVVITPKGSDVSLAGQVDSLAPDVDAVSRMVLAMASVPDAPGTQLYPGSTVHVSLARDAASGASGLP
ncbi:hypothetical protein ASNO1_42500 [Corallococcus caeni]|uniref:Efflux RND transporter periplasmic adaptor subunit n=2 Tax=Corallococcus caeni TaxID=3082388 RepID=A0ABQ6QVD8_9BACT|nr:hypothetical protein ASNO1_42500 [Corallococcus sp. NO1]